MSQSNPMPVERRRGETLTDRQARVGIVANPKRMPLHPPVPRDVWTRWPDMRSAQRRRATAQATAHMPPVSDSDPLAEYKRSVRGEPTMPKDTATGAGFAALPSRKRLIFGAFGALTFGVSGYLLYLASM